MEQFNIEVETEIVGYWLAGVEVGLDGSLVNIDTPYSMGVIISQEE